LLPAQDLLVLGPKIFRDLQLPGWVLEQEFLLKGFVKDGLQIRSRLIDPILRVLFRQSVHMRLQHEFVERIKRMVAELG
jgi:hypothetical protein